VCRKSDSQQEVNSLLERKSIWTNTDVSRFTALVRQGHALEQAEARAKAAIARTEDEVEREFGALMRVILARYHEEQVWLDKIRSVSTYGQLAMLGVNVLVFVFVLVLVEP
jgi:sensitive to high expression protein 9